MTEKNASRRIPRITYFVFLVVVIALLLVMVLLSQRATQAAPSQPIDFSHQRHDEIGIECLYCHPNALRSDFAGIPSVQTCVGCHQIIATDKEEIQVLLDYWDREEPIPWQPVVQMADHVFFSHQPHLSASINCETCHGDVGEMTAVRPEINMDMGWCLDCHLEQPEEKVARLTDCMACHE
jgi:hypothetical protein